MNNYFLVTEAEGDFCHVGVCHAINNEELNEKVKEMCDEHYQAECDVLEILDSGYIFMRVYNRFTVRVNETDSPRYKMSLVIEPIVVY